ncbi:OX-2 membrane glycoprotein-like [Alligator sinensis]|uniref:OX-2 membrane glycoprotein-like n=1 Tax=Alligator sinensis TaxID=38654 RepID=A0A1U7S0I3_ALLSI|nr:OX-2 membrane glycoprotein-like [Alligator sinensis]
MIFKFLLFSGVWTVASGSVQVTPSKVQSTKEGKNVTFLCHLISKHDVLQVTWQKESGKKENNIATYSKINGHKILDNYVGHINFTQRDLKVSAITFHAVTMEDEGCYKCIFNTFPLGSVSGRMCLEVYAISEPRVEAKLVSSPDNAGEKLLEMSCSVTGKPTPKVSWILSSHFQQRPTEYFIKHANQTVTAISSFTHVPSRILLEESLTCEIQHPSLNITLALPKDRLKQSQDLHEPKVRDVPIYVSTVLVLLVLLGCFCHCWRWQHQRKENQDLCWVLPISTRDKKSIWCTDHGQPRPTTPCASEDLLDS